MHIAVLTHNYPRFPGDFSGNFVAALSEELARQGSQVSILAPWDPAFQATTTHADRSSFSVPQIHLWRYAPRKDWHRLGYMRTMEADVRMRRDTYGLGPLFFAAGTAATLRWCRQRRPDVLHAHWLLPNGFFGAVASRLLGIPLVVSIPGSDALVAAQNPLFRAMASFALNQAGLITANSGALRDIAVDELGADPARFDLIIYGVDPDAFRPSAQGTAELRAGLAIPADAIMLLAVGRMVYKKGFDVLIRALALIKAGGLQAASGPLPPIHTVFIGDGDLWQEWQDLARQLDVAGQIRWQGPVPLDQMSVYYNAADALVMPSATQPATGLSVCVLDAMACARPIIATTAAGNDLVVREGVNGFIVPEQDPEALAAALLRFAALPPDQRSRLGQASRQFIEAEFGWPHLARRYREHFQRLIRLRSLKFEV